MSARYEMPQTRANFGDTTYKSKGILIRTYEDDAPRLWYALASIEKLARG